MQPLEHVKRTLQRARGSSSTDAEIMTSTLIIGGVVLFFAIVGLVGIAIWSIGSAGMKNAGGGSLSRWTVFATDALVAGAAASVGGLLGFLFGIPRTLDPTSKVAIAAAGDSMPVESQRAALSANTNLERISDWLTTLLVGATLVQIQSIAGWIQSLGERLSDGTLNNAAIVPVIVILFSSLSFLGVYLVTRLYLTYALQQTLVLLTGAATGASLEQFRAQVSKTLASGDAVDYVSTATTFEEGRLSNIDAEDPALNADMARLYVKILSGGMMPTRTEAVRSRLTSALRKAILWDNIKAALLDDFTAGRLKTGTDSIDLDIKTVIGAP